MSENIPPSSPPSGANPHVQLIEEFLPIVLFTLDNDGRFTVIEGRGSSQMGLADALGRLYTEVFADEPGLIIRLKQVLSERADGHWTAEVRSHTWEFHCSSLPPGPEGQPAGIMGFALNSTQRRQAEEGVRWRNREILALHSITASLTSTLEFSEVLTALERQLAVQLNLLGGAVYLTGNTGITLYKGWGVSPDLIARTSEIVISGGFWGKDPRANTRLLESLFTHSQGETLQWQCAVSVPLNGSQKPLGWLVLYGLEPLTFSKHRSAFFEMLGHQVGAALQNARMFHEVREGREELQHLSHRLVSAQEAERTRIARELHDEFGQILTCMKQSLELTERSLRTPDKAASELTNAKSLVGDMLEHVRDMTLELRTTVLDDLGLAAALHWYLERFMAQTGVLVKFDDELAAGRRFAEPIETAAYRIVQEALTNIVRYAEVEYAHIALSLQETNANFSVRVVVEDFGCGFDQSAARRPGSNGLVGMRERAIALGGTLNVQSASGSGTRIELLLPVEDVL